jgi:hypothetical protein
MGNSNMKNSLTTLALLETASMLPMAALTASAAEPAAMPMFKVMPVHGGTVKYHAPGHQPAVLQTWTATLKYSKVKKSIIMVGTNPKTSSATTTIQVFIVPIKMVYGASNGNHTFDPMVDTANGVSIVQNLLNSPLFNNMDWKFGSTDTGTTQYIDAFQRGSFWKDVNHLGGTYHVVFATPTVLSEETINVSSAQGSAETNPISGSGLIGTFPYGTIDGLLQGYIAGFSQINPSTLALFVTDNIYLTSGGCCIGGYHSAENNGQSYSYATYVSTSATHTFSSDIGAFSHELGEWLDDPGVPHFSSNFCGGIYEVGDPLEGKANYGTFPVVFNGVTWNPQNLVWNSYFGFKASASANGWLDTGHIETAVCENGQ